MVLKLGLYFCPDSHTDTFYVNKDICLFACRLMYKVIFDKPTSDQTFKSDLPTPPVNMDEYQAMEDLMAL